mmetsp:Transcript_28866/g.93931  ORF Transcript_28866/g.93931 Transcript_28866/m.93931 type:complete len:346 (+) Transcript_28866:24-1061(+)
MALEYTNGETVLSFHGEKLYFAKVLRTRKEADGSFTHFLHYTGWNKRWDEWVRAGDLLKDTEENREKKERLDIETERRKAARGGAKRRHGAALGGQSKRQRKDGAAAAAAGGSRASDGSSGADAAEGAEAEGEGGGLALVVPLPLQLKKQLVDDWELVTEQNRRVPLPRRPCVAQILSDFSAGRRKKTGGKASSIVASGLRQYFERTLHACLLYENERDQAELVIERQRDGRRHVTLAEIYGAEHLLRLFVRLEELLPRTEMTEDDVNHLLPKLGEVLKFIARNHTAFFNVAYVPHDSPEVVGELVSWGGDEDASSVAGSVASGGAKLKKKKAKPVKRKTSTTVS